MRVLALPLLLAVASSAAAGPVFETKAICRMAIAVVRERDPKLIQARDLADGVVVLNYTRPFDNFIFSYRCRVEGDRVVWADDPGRWREDAGDARISFEVDGAADRLRITVTRANGPTRQQLFDSSLNEVK